MWNHSVSGGPAYDVAGPGLANPARGRPSFRCWGGGGESERSGKKGERERRGSARNVNQEGLPTSRPDAEGESVCEEVRRRGWSKLKRSEGK